MKQLFFIISLFFTFQAGAQSMSLTGQWKASQKGDIFFLAFGADSTFIFRHGTDSLGGKNFIFGEGAATSAFKVDTSYKPAHIDMLVIQTSTGVVINKMEGIFEVMGPNKIRLRMSMQGGDRPKGFLPKGNEETLVFVKQ